MSAAAKPSLHLLDQAAPLPLQAAHWLIDEASGGAGPIDLRSTLILVPTQGAGRRLRQALAWLADAGPGTDGMEIGHTGATGVLLGPVWTPGAALKRLASWEGREPPSATDIWLAYATALLEMEEDAMRQLFPTEHLQRSGTWALQTASMMIEVRDLLAESGRDAAAVVTSGAGAEAGEGERWRILAAIERRARRELDRRNWPDPLVQQCAAAENGWLPPGIDRVVVAAVPDPVDLARQWWESVAEKCRVDVLVYAPQGLLADVDRWGRPVAEQWQVLAIPWEDWSCELEIWSRPSASGRRCAEWALHHGEAVSADLSLVVPDPSMASEIGAGMAESGVMADDLQAQGWQSHPWRDLMMNLGRFIEAGQPEALAAIGRSRPVVLWLQKKCKGLSTTAWLSALVGVLADRLPGDQESWLRGFEMRVGPANESDGNQGETQVRQAVAKAARTLLAVVHELRTAEDLAHWLEDLACLDPEGLPVAEQAHVAAASLQAWAESPLVTALGQRPGGVLQAVFGHLERCGAFGLEPEPRRLQLNGWLEVLWEDAPHLVLAGFQEGSVPETVTSHPFLPESLRRTLGLKTNDRRHARDVYLLTCALRGRGPDGRADIGLVRQSADGDPLKPSRLLFQGRDEILPERIDRLFSEALDRPANNPPVLPWRLAPRLAERPQRVRVTAFSAYLRCPFRFYLRHVLGMETTELEPKEMTAMQFGNLIHEAWELFSEDEARLDLESDADVEAALLKSLDVAVARRFGDSLPVALRVQLASARNRLRAAAPLQADSRRQGWRIISVEEQIDLGVGGLRIRGRIDRIEKREQAESGTVEYRVLDYKTSDKATMPGEAHFRRCRSGAQAARYPEISRDEVDGSTVAWTNLQLPLYVEHMRQQLGPGVQVGCGYFNLPKDAAGCGIETWTDYDLLPWHESAMACTLRVVEAIRGGEFWPPNESIDDWLDDFTDMIDQSMEESIETNWVGRLKEKWEADSKAGQQADSQ